MPETAYFLVILRFIVSECWNELGLRTFRAVCDTPIEISGIARMRGPLTRRPVRRAEAAAPSYFPAQEAWRRSSGTVPRATNFPNLPRKASFLSGRVVTGLSPHRSVENPGVFIAMAGPEVERGGSVGRGNRSFTVAAPIGLPAHGHPPRCPRTRCLIRAVRLQFPTLRARPESCRLVRCCGCRLAGPCGQPWDLPPSAASRRTHRGF